MREIVIASNNKGKIQEIQRFMSPLNIKVKSLAEMGLDDPVEDGLTYAENAIIKAMYAHKQTGLPSLGDDAGFCVESLNGFPGICSGRFAASVGGFENAFRIINDCINPIHKNCYFITTLAFVYTINGSLKQEVFEGKMDGVFTYPARGTNGFGYASVFTPNGYQETFGEMDPTKRCSINHRSIALKKFFDFYQTLINE